MADIPDYYRRLVEQAAPNPPPSPRPPSPEPPRPAPGGNVGAGAGAGGVPATYRAPLFALALPGDWADTTLFTFVGESDGPRPVMTVSVDADAPDVPLADFAGAQVQAITAGLDGCELLADGPLRLGDGTAAHRAAFTWAPSPGVRLCQDQLYVLAGGRAFVLAATYPADARLTLGPVVEAVLMSFVATG